jgi:two-component system, sensor histidine kinase
MRVKTIIHIILFVLGASAVSASAAYPVAKNGILDLRNHSFSGKVALNGEWQFFWKQLIYPQQLSINQPQIVDFPFRWDGFELNGQKLPAFGYATYKLTVLLPNDTQPRRIAIPDVYSAYRLFINGREVAANGRVTKTAKGFEPYWQNKAVDVAAGTDTLEIIWQVANFVHSKGGIKKPLELGNRNIMQLARRRAEAIDLLLTGVCLWVACFSWDFISLATVIKLSCYFLSIL